MKQKMKRFLYSIALLVMICLLFAPSSFAEESDQPQKTENTEAATPEEIRSELERRTNELKLNDWQRYYEEACMNEVFSFSDVGEMIIHYAENGADDPPEGLFEVLLKLAKTKLGGALGVVAALTSAALLTGLASTLPDSEIKPTAVFALSLASVLITASVFASLCNKALNCVQITAGFTRAALPIMTALMSSAGSVSSVGVFKPLMLFLCSTMPAFIEKVIMPLIIACGVLNIVDSLCEGGKLSETVKLANKAVKWIMGAAAVLYFGICAVQGMTASAADSLALRSAKYAADSLMPSTGGFIGGTAEVFVRCAGLVKNGAGVASLIIMACMTAEPLLAIGIGAFAFKTAAAVSRPAADASASKMLSGTADAVSLLFGAAAVASGMYMLTILVFIAAGGASLGAW